MYKRNKRENCNGRKTFSMKEDLFINRLNLNKRKDLKLELKNERRY